MHAWQFTAVGAPLIRTDVAEPTAGAGEVVLRMHGAGLCHTDVGVLTDPGWSASLPLRPVTMGHENAGEIIALGPDVEGFAIGDRVGVCPTTTTGTPGFGRHGGFAEQMSADVDNLVPIPDGVSYGLGAIATDAGMTAHSAISTAARITAGERVGIVGFGGLGQMGARIATLRGAHVYVAEPKESVWGLAREAGAVEVSGSIRDFADADLDVIVDFAGYGTTTADAISTVRPRGQVVLVGMAVLEAKISTAALIGRQVTLTGSKGGTTEDIASVYALMAGGLLNPAVTEIGFDEIADGMDRVRRHEVEGRLVAVF